MKNGTRVILNVEKITTDKSFEIKRDSYKRFVAENKNTIFLVTRDKHRDLNSPLISLIYEKNEKTSRNVAFYRRGFNCHLS